MRVIDLVLKIVEEHPYGITTGQILYIMYPDAGESQEVRSRKRSNIALRCRMLESQGYIGHVNNGRTPTWYPAQVIKDSEVKE